MMPFGELLFILLMALFILPALVLAFLLAKLMAFVSKVRLTPRDIVLIAAVFVLFFSVSSLPSRGKQDGVKVGFLGNPTRYEGAFTFHGFPAIWAWMFEPYDASTANLFLFPINIFFDGVAVDFIFWLVIAMILTYSTKVALTRMKSGKKSEHVLPQKPVSGGVAGI